MERTLSIGEIVILRPIAPTDKGALTAALEAMSPETRHRRFLGPKTAFSTKELRYLTEVDGRDHVAIVAELPDRPGELAAVARWVRLATAPDTAEFAIVVGDELQGKGLGSLLADELAATAKLNGVKRFTASTLSENEPILRIMARLATHLDRHHTGMGTSEVAFDLAA